VRIPVPGKKSQSKGHPRNRCAHTKNQRADPIRYRQPGTVFDDETKHPERKRTVRGVPAEHTGGQKATQPHISLTALSNQHRKHYPKEKRARNIRQSNRYRERSVVRNEHGQEFSTSSTNHAAKKY